MMFSINDRQFYRQNTRLHSDTYAVWKDAVNFINRINIAAVRLPDDSNQDLKTKILESSVQITDRVAKAADSRCAQTLERRLRNAIEAVHETMAQLYVAKQWNYVTEDYYQELFEEGRGMVDKLCLFGGFSYTQGDIN